MNAHTHSHTRARTQSGQSITLIDRVNNRKNGVWSLEVQIQQWSVCVWIELAGVHTLYLCEWVCEFNPLTAGSSWQTETCSQSQSRHLWNIHESGFTLDHLTSNLRPHQRVGARHKWLFVQIILKCVVSIWLFYSWQTQLLCKINGR